ncbi:MAG: transglycosylase SLT domain-containing protein [Candidatus Moduliflexus flocculans]|nr:transglycosylase SLT domain-containing protein [Candidatus Moduliflexus flocculans]
MEGALAKLDEAYGLLIRMAIPADSPSSRKRTTSASSSPSASRRSPPSGRPWPRRSTAPSPSSRTSGSPEEIKSFQTVERQGLRGFLPPVGPVHGHDPGRAAQGGLPEQLAWIPVIESAFKPRALSRARALGMWQFVRSTGYRYGLKQDKYVDERMDPAKSTRAAIQYMMELHDMFGDWTTAIAAYNCGEGQVQRVIRAQKVDYFDSFWDIFANLPFETARHVPRFIATLLIVGDPAKYGFQLPTPDPPVRFDTVRVNAAVKLATLSQNLGLDPAVLVGLNSELRHDSTPNYPYDLRVPAGYGDECLACIASLPQYIPPDVVTDRHTVRSGDTLGAIARRYRTSVDAIKRLNGLRSQPHPGRAGPARPLARRRRGAAGRRPGRQAGRDGHLHRAQRGQSLPDRQEPPDDGRGHQGRELPLLGHPLRRPEARHPGRPDPLGPASGGRPFVP